MGERSFAVPLLLAALLVVNIFGLYFAIDATSEYKRQAASAEQALQSLESTVSRFGRELEEQSASGLSPELEEKLEQLLRQARQSSDASEQTETNATPGEGGQLDGGETLKPFGFFAQDGERDPEAEDGGRRISYTSAFSNNLNDIVNNSAIVSSIWQICNDQIGERDLIDVRRFVPRMAASWHKSEDGLVYTIRLRKGILWHPFTDIVTGEKVPEKEVTADDFVFWWETVQNPKVPADPIRNYIIDIETIEKVDRYTFRVVWREPYSLADQITLQLSPLPAHYYRPDPNWSDDEFAEQFITSKRNQHMIGCGAYRLVRWTKGQDLRMERFGRFFGPKPSIKHLLIREIQEPNIALLEFKSGKLDRIGFQPEQWIYETAGKDFYTVTPDVDTCIEDSAAYDERKRAGETPTTHEFEKYMYPSYAWRYIGWNLRKPLFKEKQVRWALTHCIDRKRILEDVYHGFGQVITGPFVPQSPYYNHQIEAIPFDLEAAKKLLQEAGWRDSDGDNILDKDLDGDGTPEPFAFTLAIVSSINDMKRYATIIQEDMKKVGIDMQIKPSEWSVYTEMLNERSYDACTLLWSGSIESDPRQIWHSSQADLKVERSSNHVSYASAEADKLIEEGRRTTDVDKRIAIYKKFHEIVHDDQPYAFLFRHMALVGQHRRYRNVRIYKLGMNANLHWVPRDEQKAFE